MLHEKNTQNKVPAWIHPWDVTVHNDIQNDDRFFSLVIRSLLQYLDTQVRMYGKPIRHFILSTGSSYLYQETNGYEFSWSETTGEDFMYMEKPRCTVEWQDIEITQNDLSSPYSRGQYERAYWNEEKQCKEYRAFSGEVKVLPLKLPITLRYTLANFNESLILMQEILEIFSFTRYFSFTYLGVKIDCSVEFPLQMAPTKQIKMDYSAESKDRQMELKLDLKTYFPVIMDQSEISVTDLIKKTYSTVTVGSDESTRLPDDDKETWLNNFGGTYSSEFGEGELNSLILGLLRAEFPDIYDALRREVGLYKNCYTPSMLVQALNTYRREIYKVLKDEGERRGWTEQQFKEEYIKEMAYLYKLCVQQSVTIKENFTLDWERKNPLGSHDKMVKDWEKYVNKVADENYKALLDMFNNHPFLTIESFYNLNTKVIQ